MSTTVPGKTIRDPLWNTIHLDATAVRIVDTPEFQRLRGIKQLGTASLVKAMLLSKILGQRINTFRWPLVWAAAPAVLVGWLATRLPEWAELIIGIPAILGVYGLIIWRRGFGPEDRVLFKRNLDKEEAAAAD